MSDQKIIYSMHRVSKTYPPSKTVIKDISLSYFYGAKIGVIGLNGSGKSSLLKIMAGLDDGYSGEARLTAGFTVGYLAQEPQLDPEKTVRENVMDGVAEVQSIIDEYNAVMEKWADPDADYDKLCKEQALLEDTTGGVGVRAGWLFEEPFDTEAAIRDVEFRELDRNPTASCFVEEFGGALDRPDSAVDGVPVLGEVKGGGAPDVLARGSVQYSNPNLRVVPQQQRFVTVRQPQQERSSSPLFLAGDQE